MVNLVAAVRRAAAYRSPQRLYAGRCGGARCAGDARGCIVSPAQPEPIGPLRQKVLNRPIPHRSLQSQKASRG